MSQLLKTREELTELIRRISCSSSPVGMDAVYVHALILDKLEQIEQRTGFHIESVA